MQRMRMTPIGSGARIASMDVLRGLALLGIFLMNIEWFTRPLVGRAEGIDTDLQGLALWLDAGIYIFVGNKFWTLFSLLFGMGFAVMQARAQAADQPFTAVYLRRTSGLLLIGALHACLVWSGDILVAYSITAFLLLALFQRVPTAGLWAWGSALYFSIVVLMMLMALLLGLSGDSVDPADAARRAAGTMALQQDEVAAYSRGSYLDATVMRLRFQQAYFASGLFLLPMALGLFVFGAWMVRRGIVADPASHRRLLRAMVWAVGPLGLALTLFGVAIDPRPDLEAPDNVRALWASSLHLAGGPLMAMGYLGLVVLALDRGARWLGVLAPAGRMALTLYLTQSLVGTLVFYGYGLGLWGQVGRVGQVVLVLSVFALQLAFAHLWMARFRHGPVEWLWRGFTYLDLPPLRRASTASLQRPSKPPVP